MARVRAFLKTTLFGIFFSCFSFIKLTEAKSLSAFSLLFPNHDFSPTPNSVAPPHPNSSSRAPPHPSSTDASKPNGDGGPANSASLFSFSLVSCDRGISFFCLSVGLFWFCSCSCSMYYVDLLELFLQIHRMSD